jgi:hypothetical protein
MGRQKGHRQKQKSKPKDAASLSSSLPTNSLNFSLDAGPGCHIARKDTDDTAAASAPASAWVIEWEDLDADEFQGEEIPDLAIDPEESTLSLCNARNEYVVAYISVYDTILRDRQGCKMQQGSSTDNENVSTPCTTLIVLCPPCTFCHLCYLDLPADGSLENLRLDSDVQVWNKHRVPADTHAQTIGFPLQGGPYRCTQGESGHLTHFFAGNLHAIDFSCPVGTPLLAVGDGVVVECKDSNSLTGIAVSNLFEWNSIILQLDTAAETVAEASRAIFQEKDEVSSGPLFVEYVHLKKVKVQAGERVKAGQVIGLSGSVGFSPEPHLHFSAYRSQESTAATVRVYFHSTKDDQATFLPKAGIWYDANGPVNDPGTTKPS